METPAQVIESVLIESEKTYAYRPAIRMDLAIESMHQYAEARVEIAQTYWAERIEELVEQNAKYLTTRGFDDLVEEMKTAKYFP